MMAVITRRAFLKILASFTALAVLLAEYSLLFETLSRPRITRYAVRPRNWPAGLPLKVAAIADLHACEPWMDADRVRAIVETVNGLGADIILLLGDYEADHRFVHRRLSPEVWSGALGGLKAPLGVHAIQGNHDWWDDKAALRSGEGPTYGRVALEKAGIPVYENDAVRIVKGDKSFWLAGLGDALAFQTSRSRKSGRPMGVDDLEGTLEQVPAGEPVILMAHEPDVMVRVPGRVSLVLSGHTHGGQVRFFGWAPVVPSRYGQRYAYGHVREQCDLIVSGGLGCSGLPLRFGMPPEIVVVDIAAPGSAEAAA